MVLSFFFLPSPFEIAVFAGACFFVLLPELHYGYCYARWFQSRDRRWLDRDEQWEPPRWMFAVAWVLACFIAAVALSVRQR